MPGPKYITAPRDENASGTGSLLGRQEKPRYLPGVACELRATEMEQGETASLPDI